MAFLSKTSNITLDAPYVLISDYAVDLAVKGEDFKAVFNQPGRNIKFNISPLYKETVEYNSSVSFFRVLVSIEKWCYTNVYNCDIRRKNLDGSKKK